MNKVKETYEDRLTKLSKQDEDKRKELLNLLDNKKISRKEFEQETKDRDKQFKTEFAKIKSEINEKSEEKKTKFSFKWLLKNLKNNKN